MQYLLASREEDDENGCDYRQSGLTQALSPLLLSLIITSISGSLAASRHGASLAFSSVLLEFDQFGDS